MKRFIIALAFAGLFIIYPFSPWNPVKNLWARPADRYSLQVASLPNTISARKEIERLKSFNIQAQIVPREDRSNKTWFVIYMMGFQTKEEAARQGNQLVQKKIIKNFKVFTEKIKAEIPSPEAKEAPPAPTIPLKKEASPSLGKNRVYFGPISIKEEESSIQINIKLDRKLFPEITADKIAEGSRLIVTFKNIDRVIVPIEFDKVQSKALLSLSLAQKGPDCIFIIVLKSTFNYDVAQNYYEKEKIYSLVIGMEPAAGPGPIKKE